MYYTERLNMAPADQQQEEPFRGGEPIVLDFTPDASGTFTFVCGMDMQRGTIVVES